MELGRAFGVNDIKRAASRLDQGVPPTALLSIDDESAMPPMALSLFQHGRPTSQAQHLARW
jgi:hypothetical protein